MAWKRNRPPRGRGGAVLEDDLAGRLIVFDNTPPHPQMQAPRLARYVVDDHLIVVEATYA